jgi:hypothetical protein
MKSSILLVLMFLSAVVRAGDCVIETSEGHTVTINEALTEATFVSSEGEVVEYDLIEDAIAGSPSIASSEMNSYRPPVVAWGAIFPGRMIKYVNQGTLTLRISAEFIDSPVRKLGNVSVISIDYVWYWLDDTDVGETLCSELPTEVKST